MRSEMAHGNLHTVSCKLIAFRQSRSIGVSNFTKPDLEELMSTAKITPAVNQVKSFTTRFKQTFWAQLNMFITDSVESLHFS